MKLYIDIGASTLKSCFTYFKSCFLEYYSFLVKLNPKNGKAKHRNKLNNMYKVEFLKTLIGSKLSLERS